MKPFVFLGALISSVGGAVIEATDADIETYLSNGVPTIVDLWAPWCTHCKSFSPKFDELAALYEHLPDRIQFVKVDGEANRQTAKRFNLEYFPTIKYVDGEEQEEIHDRSIKNLKKVIKSKVGVIPDDPPSKPAEKPAEKQTASNEPKVSRDAVERHVVEFVDENFEDGVDGKHALVSFTTTWCHYCKDLRPEWEKAAKLYAHDDDILFVNVDCTDPENVAALMETFHVDGYPTIVYFPADGSVPKPYAGPRTLDGFVDFFKRLGISSREASGELNPDAGIIPDIDVFNLKKAEKQLKKSDSAFKDKYLHIIKKAKSDAGYVEREIKRLSGILDAHKAGSSLINAASLDNIQIRLNILKSFVPNKESDTDSKKEL